MNPLSLNLRNVTRFVVVQCDTLDDKKEPIIEEKEFKSLREALDVIKKSEAPTKWLAFNHEGIAYKLHPTPEDDGEFIVTSGLIMN